MKRTKPDRLYITIFIGSIVGTLLLSVYSDIREDFITAQLAETDATLTDTGALLALEAERIDRAYGFLLRMQSRESVRDSFAQKQLERRRKLVAHQMECQDEVRRANRDTKLPTLTRCYRTQLTLHLESLRKERAYVEKTMVGLTEEPKQKALDAIDNLVDAITTIIDGLDAGVYSSQNGLEEAKLNLAEKYWIPWWHARLKLHADRLTSWIAHFLVHINERLTKPDLFGEDEELLANMHACLVDEESRLKAVIASLDYNDTTQRLKESYEKTVICFIDNPPAPPEDPQEFEEIDDQNMEEAQEQQVSPHKNTRRNRYWEN